VTPEARSVQRTYLLLTLLATLATSFIWGVNTLFLLDGGLDNTQAFAANAFYTVGQVLFEVPTGVVADTWGRRISYLLGTVTLLGSTLLYLLMWQIEAPFWGWASASILLGLGYTFFSGAVEAWLVDALTATGYVGDLDAVFARGQAVTGAAMLSGSVAGGFVAQATSLAVPYVLRAAVLGITMLAAFALMRDIGFTPGRGRGPLAEMRRILSASLDNGWRKRPIRWVMLAGPFTMGVGVYAFYAMQPYLLELYGDPRAYGVAGLAAAAVAGAQILGGLLVPVVRRRFRRRTHVLIAAAIVSVAALTAIGLVSAFWPVVTLLVVWSITFTIVMPIRQAYLNGLIPSEQRATVLSFDALVSSSGGVAAQPALGRAADVWSYSTSYVVGAVIQVAAVPFLALARAEDSDSDLIRR
jgi:MFS family permease